MRLKIPKDYKPKLNFTETEKAIHEIKNFFQKNIAQDLNLIRATSPLFIRAKTGINDDLNGIEKPVSFSVKSDGNSVAEIVQSLAKWKRMALHRYGLEVGEGIYTDMNAIRPDEELDNLHSLYVDQWDWEKVIQKDQRNLDYLKNTVRKIYRVLKETETFICNKYKNISPILPDEIYFIHSEELEKMYPHLTPKEREVEICKKEKAVFVIGIGANLESGKPHDGRAADYDDWTTPTHNGFKGLNGDIIFWNPILECEFEISSMGIRVDPEALKKQLKIKNQVEKEKLLFHKKLLNNELPLCIGGGIGQSRICMFFLRKAHIGEVQCSIWSDEMLDVCRKNNIDIL
jgi:aspartate--ammonia ligase